MKSFKNYLLETRLNRLLKAFERKAGQKYFHNLKDSDDPSIQSLQSAIRKAYEKKSRREKRLEDQYYRPTNIGLKQFHDAVVNQFLPYSSQRDFDSDEIDPVGLYREFRKSTATEPFFERMRNQKRIMQQSPNPTLKKYGNMPIRDTWLYGSIKHPE